MVRRQSGDPHLLAGSEARPVTEQGKRNAEFDADLAQPDVGGTVTRGYRANWVRPYLRIKSVALKDRCYCSHRTQRLPDRQGVSEPDSIVDSSPRPRSLWHCAGR